MAISKVILNGVTQMDVTDDTVVAAKLFSGYQATGANGQKVSGNYVEPYVPVLEASKTVTISSNTTTTVIPTTGYDAMEEVVITTSVPTPSLEASKTVTISGSGTTTVNPSTGYDAMEQVSVSVPAGSATTPATTITANPSISVSSGGLITASVSASQNVTPTISAGWVSSGAAGAISVGGSNTSQLTTKAAATYTPTTSDQTIASGQYLTGAQTIQGDANLLAGNIKKDVSIFGVTGTLEGSSYTLLATQDFTVSTTSTTAYQVGTIDLGASAFTDASIIYVRVRDKAGRRSGYFIGSDAYFYNYRAANGSTSSLSVRMCITHRLSDSTYTSYATSSNTGYGVYASALDADGKLSITRRYSSTYSLTINGTYEVKVYALGYCPDQGNPFDYSYS